MRLRDETEEVLRSWNAYETSRNAPAVLDFDCAPGDGAVPVATSRLTTANRLESLLGQAERAGQTCLAVSLNAHLAYVYALLGHPQSLDDYVLHTQGCHTWGWPEDYIAERGRLAREQLSAVGITWGPNTADDLNAFEGPIGLDDAVAVLHQTLHEYEPTLRQVAGTTATYALDVATVREDAYWAYWLDGAGQQIRLRLNLRNAKFTKVQARQFTLHEILGHGLQSVSFAQQCTQRDVPWVRLLSVHAPQQVLLEGLAQAMPMFVAPNDDALIARVRLVHYTQLVRAELHLAVNAGVPVRTCAEQARSRVPFWSDDAIADLLTDRGNNALLRSYLWSYPAGIDWFVRLAEDGDPATIERVLQAAYRDPLTPNDLVALWPAGPSIGGPGSNGSAAQNGETARPGQLR